MPGIPLLNHEKSDGDGKSYIKSHYRCYFHINLSWSQGSGPGGAGVTSERRRVQRFPQRTRGEVFGRDGDKCQSTEGACGIDQWRLDVSLSLQVASGIAIVNDFS